MVAIGTLIDDFSAGGQWTLEPGAVIANGVLTITTSTAYPIAYIDAACDLTGSAAIVEARTVANTGNGGTETYLELTNLDFTESISLNVNNGQLRAFRKVGGGSSTLIASVAYSSASHRWWRLRESGGTLLWETSPGGGVTWNIEASLASDITITALYPLLGSGYFGTEPAPGAAVFDNFNLPPPRSRTVPRARLIRAANF